MQMCPFCDKVYDESEYSHCSYCSSKLEDDMSERYFKKRPNCGGMCMDKSNQNMQVIEEGITDKNRLVVWIKSHKKQLIRIGVSITAIITIVLGVQNQDALKKALEDLQDKIKEANLYSDKWFERATDEELGIEREKIRLEYCSSGDNFDAACRLQNLLWRFDKELGQRAWGDKEPHGPSVHREHGWYLPNDD